MHHLRGCNFHFLPSQASPGFCLSRSYPPRGVCTCWARWSECISTFLSEGIHACLFRPKTLYPFPYKALKEAAQGKKFVLCAELSMGQMIQDVRLSLEGSVPVHFYGRAGGMVFEPKELVNSVKEHYGGR